MVLDPTKEKPDGPKEEIMASFLHPIQTLSKVLKPEVVLVGDFTRIPYKGGVIYLATFMDLYTREIVGWNISTRHTTEFVMNALFDAIKTLGIIPKIVHTDQGSEYQSKDYAQMLSKLGVKVSMSK
jgi:putative transposase